MATIALKPILLLLLVLQGTNCSFVRCNQKVCPRLFFRMGATCLRVYHTASTWNRARSICKKAGGSLAELTNTHMNGAFVADALNQVTGNSDLRLWLGANDHNQEGVWMWNSGSTQYMDTIWRENQPDNYLGNEHCLEFYTKTGKANDLPCTHKLKFVCQV